MSASIADSTESPQALGMALHLDRQAEIVRILSRNGFHLLAARSGLARRILKPGFLDAFTPDGPPHDEAFESPEIIRRTLQELGPTFIKLGQILSTRPDLVHPDLATQLAKLQDQDPPMPIDQTRRLIARELGTPIDEAFLSFDEEVVGSGSLAQAHGAVLPDGSRVVVKIQREGIVHTINADLEILQNVVRELARQSPSINELGVAGFFEEFSRQLRGELDFEAEGRNAERIQANFAQSPGLHIPRIDWSRTTTRMLTEERLSGVKITDVDALDLLGVDRSALADRATTVILDMVLRDGFFHADPHPGNMLVQPDGVIGLLDYGMVGSLTDNIRNQLIDVVIALSLQHSDRLAAMLLRLAPPPGRIDRTDFAEALARIIDRYTGLTLKELPAGELITAVMDLMRRYHLQVPPAVAMVSKMLVMCEGTGLVLDPEFSISTALKPYALDLLQRRLQPSYLGGRLLTGFLDVADLGLPLPARLTRILDRYEQEGMGISIDPEQAEPYVRRVEDISERLVAGMLLASLINAIGVLGSTDNRWLSRVRGPLLVIGSVAAAGLVAFIAINTRLALVRLERIR
ncbi:AarF/ABC1/UbiB kinase family protein [Cryobacterium sp. TMT1-21]|uniref:AarF/ABC1/UbiB kinase family protein n=2 Tax=Microbacteriaceae TaxID=85023 RepID=A0AAQ2HGR8_9MICO|nr:AarF/ABC1/UbiB kinase family protein [Cryobacterium shii]TFD11940.1 AarF/ABC1/UbiB kinase family protein [Cryobacterium sp. TMT1-21]TFD18944.1 AarF/ABC1/UbiB kinase family protein [Cryobacterium sp. TMT2-23]TFD35748.1 AarF/ABC1/UbiB kinase family protein [Cryobacterium sp. TMT2-10]